MSRTLLSFTNAVYTPHVEKRTSQKTTAQRLLEPSCPLHAYLFFAPPAPIVMKKQRFAFERAGAVAERVHINRLIENPALHDRYQVLCLPGGFSYGDDIAAGRILATRLRQHLSGMVDAFVHGRGDRLVLGICNGMQVLMRLGVLSEGVGEGIGDGGKLPATLTWNNHGRFEDRWVHLAVDKTPCVFLTSVAHLYLPVAHAEGKFVTANPCVLEELKQQGRLALRYCMPPQEGDPHAGDGAGQGRVEQTVLSFPDNPNGADANVAGICDASGRVLGMMPHPERHVDPTQHPAWTRRIEQPEFGDGMVIFRNAVEWFS